MKKSIRTLPVFIFILSLTACAHSTIVSFQPNETAYSTQATDPQKIEIYRVARPFESFTELGLISFRASVMDLTGIYKQLRIDAAKAGADAIVDLKITGESHEETRTTQSCTSSTVCNADGVCMPGPDTCVPVDITETVTSYLAVGSLIKRKVNSP